MVLSLILSADVSTDETRGAAFFGFMGVAMALIFANFGAAYGTAKSGVGICFSGVLFPDKVMKSIIPMEVPPSLLDEVNEK